MLAEPIRKYYWDACAWIGFISAEAGKISALRAIWADAKAGKCELWTSAFNYLEVIKAKNEDGDPIPLDQSDAQVDAMFSQPYVQMVQVDQIVAKLARDLRRIHGDDGLKGRPDAIHLATAIHYNLDEFHTWDGQHLLPLNGKIFRRDGKLLPIVIPDGAHAVGPMFGGISSEDLTASSLP
jgi:predicted nucleic acid-binding protein